MFSTQSDNLSPFVRIFDIISLFAAKLEEPKLGISGKGLRGFTKQQKFRLSASAIFTDNNFKLMVFPFQRLENIVEKQENDEPAFSSFYPECFQTPISTHS